MRTEKSIIYIDSRETKRRIKLLKKEIKKYGSKYTVKIVPNMDVGDIVYGRLAFELKKMYQFVGDIKTGNVFEQVLKMTRAGFEHIYFSVCYELDEFDEIKSIGRYGMNKRAVIGAEASLASPRYKCTVLKMESEADQIYQIYKIIEKSDFQPININKSKINPKMTRKDTQLNMLLQIKGLGIVKARKLLEEFSYSTKAIANAPASEIMKKVKGIGPQLASRIKTSLR
jgi:ERCC4-type nuclease